VLHDLDSAVAVPVIWRREGPPLKIFQLVTRRQRRGAEVFATQLGDALAARGHLVTVAGLYSPPEDPLVPTRALFADLADRRRRPISLPLLRALIRWLADERPDVVQANGSDTLKYAALARRITGGDWRLVYRNISIASRWLRYPGQRRWMRWLVSNVDHVAAVSDASLLDFSETFGIDRSRISMIPIGAEVPERLDRARWRNDLARVADVPESADLLVHVGSFSPEKNHEGLLAAFARIHVERPTARLVLVGDGPLREEVDAQVRRLGLADSVRLLGSRSDAATLSGGADLVLLPSHIEGLPGVVLEAFAHGTPVVATDVGSLADVVEPGRTGLLVQPGRDEAFAGALAAAVLQLLANPAQRDEFGARGRDAVLGRYSMSGVVERFETLYSRLLTEHA
jgi:L-malate glycosyltransferase